MKNVKKLLKKAMVFTVAASMLVGTPLTASAAGIRGVYSISDGTDTVKENPNDSGTGTVTNTNTETKTGVLEEYDAKIIGIVLDQENVNAEKGKPKDLKATVILDGSLDADMEAEVQKKLASKIRWEVSNADGSKDTNPAATVGIQSSAADRSVVTLNPKKGTKKGKEILVTATIDRSYFWVEKRDENGEVVKDEATGKPVLEMKNTGIEGDPYTASAKVFVKEYSEKLAFDEAKIKEKLTDGKSTDYTALLKHTVDLSECLVRTPVTANDTITWISTNTKVATVTAAGVVTFKKIGEGSILAVGEKGVQAKYTFTVEAGQAASRVEIVDEEDASLKNTTINLEGDETDDGDSADPVKVGVKMYAKIKGVIVSNKDSKKAAADSSDFKMKNGKVVTGNVEVANGDHYFLPTEDKAGGIEQDELYITDTITWTSNKKAIADVVGDTDGATITALSVGKAAITAKSSAGKSCKLNVTVTATLTDLEIGNVPENGMYSGQTVTLTALKNPRANKDAVVWSILKESGNKKNPNATINSKGELKIKPKLNDSKDDYLTVEVELKSKKKYDYVNEKGEKVNDFISATATIELQQSSIDEIYVYDGEDKVASAVTEYKADNTTFKKIVKNGGISKAANTRTINVPKGKTFDIQAIVAKEFNMDEADATGTLSFKSSSTKVATIKPEENGSKLTVTANAKGSSTVTVSGVRVNGTKASTISTTFKVNVVQPVKTLTMNKPVVTINEKLKSGKITNQAVSLKVTLGPKGVNTKEAIKWEVKQTMDKGEIVADAEYALAHDAKNKDLTKASASVNLPTPEVGDQFVIKASTKSGATATATVNVVTKTTAVAIAQSNTLKSDKTPNIFMDGSKKNTRTAKIGEEFNLYPFINVGKSSRAADIDWRATNENGVFAEDGKNIEGVTYSVNKKGVVNIDADGTVHVINKGTVTITAKTPQGKKGTVKVVVKDLTLFGASEN